MRIYQSDSTTPAIKSKRKNTQKKYKSINNLQYHSIQTKASGVKGKKQKKKISNKNIRFLEGIGLKVKK